MKCGGQSINTLLLVQQHAGAVLCATTLPISSSILMVIVQEQMQIGGEDLTYNSGP